jgi:hypothetical protein
MAGKRRLKGPFCGHRKIGAGTYKRRRRERDSRYKYTSTSPSSLADHFF